MTKIYIGPSIPGVVQTGASFSGGYPPMVAAALKAQPFLQELMVVSGELAQAKKETRNSESRLGMLYRKAEGGY